MTDKSNGSPAPSQPSFAERVAEYEKEAIILGVVDAPMSINSGDVYAMIQAIREQQAALDKLCEVYDAMGAPRGPSRIIADAVLAKWRIK